MAVSSANHAADTTLVEIPCGTVTLTGELAIPLKANGVVIFVHGSGSSRHSPRNQFVARRIQESGIGTLLFDLLTEEEEVDAVTADLRFDIGLLAERLTTVTQWLSEQPIVEDRGLGYFGASTGCAAALLAVSKGRNMVDAVVSRGGRPDLVGQPLLRVDIPTLLIVGGDDGAVIRLNEKAYSVMRCKKELKIVPGAGHLFEEPSALEEVADMAAHWFLKYLHRHPTAIVPVPPLPLSLSTAKTK